MTILDSTEPEAKKPAATEPATTAGNEAAPRNGGAAIAETLKAHGVDTIFGIPGTHNLEIYRHLVRLGITTITSRHEQGAGYAADGYTQVAGKPGVVITTSGPAVLNAMVAAGTSYAESRPVLIISSGLPSGTDYLDGGELHDTKDTLGAMTAMTEWATRAATPQEASDAVAHAFEVMGQGRPRPVFIEVPHDVLADAWAGDVSHATSGTNPAVDAAAIGAAAEVLMKAKRPAIVAGGGARGADAQVRELAELLQAPVISTCNGKGVLPETHPLSLGANIRLTAAHDWLNESDGLLVVGSELGDSDLWEGKIVAPNLVRVDIADSQLQLNAAARVGVHADAAEALTAIIERVRAAGGRPTEAGVADAGTAAGADTGTAGGPDAGSGAAGEEHGSVAELRAAFLAEALVDGETWYELNTELRAALPDDAIITGDSSQVTYLGTVHFFDVPAKNSFLYMPRSATLGYALPAAIGAKAAKPDAPVVALLGDGAFMFSVQELVTAVEHRLPVVVIVANNGGYREIRDQQALRGIAPVGVDLHVPDLPALAQAIGATGERATDAKDAAARAAAALGRPGPTLIAIDF